MLSNIKFALENKPENKSIHYNRQEGQKMHLWFFVVMLFCVGFMVIIFSFICLIRQTIISHMDTYEVARQKKTDKFSN